MTDIVPVEREYEIGDESLRVASEIQRRMLPAGVVDLPASSPFTLRAHIQPARHVGGDLYDFFWTDSRLPWVAIDPHLVNFPRQPPDRQPLYDAWAAAVSAADPS